MKQDEAATAARAAFEAARAEYRAASVEKARLKGERDARVRALLAEVEHILRLDAVAGVDEADATTASAARRMDAAREAMVRALLASDAHKLTPDVLESRATVLAGVRHDPPVVRKSVRFLCSDCGENFDELGYRPLVEGSRAVLTDVDEVREVHVRAVADEMLRE